MPSSGVTDKGYSRAPVEEVNGAVEMGKLNSKHPSENATSYKDKGGEAPTSHSPGVTYRGHRRRTKLELYLAAVCLLLVAACLAFIIIAFARDHPRLDSKNEEKHPGICLSSHCVKTAAQLLEAIDWTVDPCTDFFQFACGSWNRKHTIPEDKSGYNTFEELSDKLQVILKGLLEDPPNEHDSNATLQTKTLYKSCMNVGQIEKIGDKPLRVLIEYLGGFPVIAPQWNATRWTLEHVLGNWPSLTKISLPLFKLNVDIDDKNSSAYVMQIERIGDDPLRLELKLLGGWPVIERDWNESGIVVERLLGQLRGRYNAPLVLDSWVAADDKNSTNYILQLDQPSLGMPSKEYYLKSQDKRGKQAYLDYMVNLATLMGANRSHALREMKKVLHFETELANVSLPQNQRHDTGVLYSKKTIRDLQLMVPQLDWLSYLNEFLPVPITEDEKVVSFADDFLKKMGKLLERTDKRVLANYVIWRLIMGLAPELTARFRHYRNEYRKVIQGVSRDKVRWQKCVVYVNERMGMALGRMFVRENFPKQSKDTALEMIHNIREAFNEILAENNWMDESTKGVAKEKANAMNERIGYPEFILEPKELDKAYKGLSFLPETYFENVLQVEKYDARRNLGKLGQPVRKDKWEQDPAIVNAFYNPNTNDIVFPAGILQPLFYSEHFPKSLNYGGIGVVIGHEITHGFDDKGRQYDKDGNLKQWWKDETIQAFRKRAQCMVHQYSTYKLEPFGLYIDGKNTQGENIADNGGLKESFRAYRKWVSRNGEEPLLPGVNLTHNQLFFLNYAQIWCGIMRGEEAIHKIRTSVHSPGPIRVQGPLSNSYDFAAAYKCPRGSRMNPDRKCSLW